MLLVKFMILSAWVTLLVLLCIFVIFRIILPRYRVITSQVSFDDLILVLNAEINSELDMWKSDVFTEGKGIANNSQYENYYNEISMTILKSLSPIYFTNMEKYMTSEAIVSIIGRRVKNFLNEYVQESFPDPSVKMLFDDH